MLAEQVGGLNNAASGVLRLIGEGGKRNDVEWRGWLDKVASGTARSRVVGWVLASEQDWGDGGDGDGDGDETGWLEGGGGNGTRTGPSGLGEVGIVTGRVRQLGR